MSQTRATQIGAIAVLLWATLAPLTAFAGAIPPFQLTAMTFAVAFAISLVWWGTQAGRIIDYLKLPPRVWLLGVGGLFGYHFFYFIALQNAPEAEASLIAYLWPLLIVLFSALLPGEQLRGLHILGGLMGLAGAGLLVTRGEALALDPRFTFGYSMAILCALIWSSYSVVTRRFGEIPTTAVGGFCGVTAVLAFLCHLLFETTTAPQTVIQWIAIAGLGLGPMGIAFFTWDFGVKRGNIKTLGILSYAAPLLSTIFLVLLGLAEASWFIALGCLLIVGGAACGAYADRS